MKKIPLIPVALVLFVVAGIAASGQEKKAEAAASPSPYVVELDAGLGWDQLFNASFAGFMAANGMTAIDPQRTWRTGWRFSYGLNRFYAAVGGSRTTNFIFGAYGDTQRTRFVWDSTDLTAGVRIVSTDTISWTLGAGVAVSKLLLQAYGAAGGSFASLYGSAGFIDLVSSGNWAPEAETFFAVRILSMGDSASIWLKAGVQGGWLPLDSKWKLFDDPEVTGVPKPFDFVLRYSLWIGVR